MLAKQIQKSITLFASFSASLKLFSTNSVCVKTTNFKGLVLTFSFMLMSLNGAQAQGFDFKYQHKLDRPRNEILAPFVSFFLPGADQWVEGQYQAASLYSGYAALGLATAVYQLKRIDELDLSTTPSDQMPTNSREQLLALGSQAYMFSGFMSAYHSFRSSVKTRHQISEYLFLQDNEDTLPKLALAPFDFKFMSRWTTLVPLGLVAALISAGVSSENNTYTMSSSDWAFTSGVSYHAGVGEEAFFRGFLYPYFYEKFDNQLIASGASSLVFAAGHVSPNNSIPWVQFAFGTYMDYLTTQNKWSIQESIFIHFWWDIIAISGAFIIDSDEASNQTHFVNLLKTNF